MDKHSLAWIESLMTSQQNSDTVGVILAGGKSRRMGVADKALLPLAGTPLLEYVIDRAKPQVAYLLLSANGDPARFAAYPMPIVADIYADEGGPLAGIISAMAYASKSPTKPKWLATFPCDAPLAPPHWVSQLRADALSQQLEVAVAADPYRTHYTFALWSCDILAKLKQQYASGERALHRTMQSLRSSVSVCSSDARAFTNLNTPEQLQRLTNEAHSLSQAEAQGIAPQERIKTK